MSTSRNSLPKISSYSFLDAWRGLAAMGVVMVHSCLPYIVNHEPEAIKNPLFRISMWGSLGVVLFFVISGYCISSAAYNCIRTDKSLRQYAFDRIRRIYPPYLVACIISLVLTWLVFTLQSWHILPSYSGVPPKALPFKDISFWLTNLTLTHIPLKEPGLLIVSWSLCYEAAFYLIIGVFLLLSRMVSPANSLRRGRVLTCIHITITLLSLIWLLVSPETCPFPLDLWYQFGLGALLFAIVSNKEWRAFYLVKISAVTSIILCVLYGCYGTSTEASLKHASLRDQVLVCVIFFLILLLL
jgi:exopolysaccharide production protein ExoZ